MIWEEEHWIFFCRIPYVNPFSNRFGPDMLHISGIYDADMLHFFTIFTPVLWQSHVSAEKDIRQTDRLENF